MTLSQLQQKDIGRDLVLNHFCFSLERKSQTENSKQKNVNVVNGKIGHTFGSGFEGEAQLFDTPVSGLGRGNPAA